jgi:hypothetical protein
MQGFDFMIPIVDLTHQDHQRYAQDIRDSNLPTFTKNGLYYLMDMARQHTKAALQNGWLNWENPEA